MKPLTTWRVLSAIAAAHQLIIENEYIDASVDLDRIVRRNGIESRERRVGNRRIECYERNIHGAERSDCLGLAVFENLEIGLREAAHELPARIQHAHGYLHVVDLGSKRCTGLRCVLSKQERTGGESRHDTKKRFVH